MLNKLKYYYLLLTVFLLSPIYSLKAAGLGDATKNLKTTGGKMGFKTESVEIEQVVGSLIQALLALLGVIFLVLVIYGGFLWMTAQGNDKQIEKARNTMINGVIGLVIVVSAYAISTYVLSTLLNSLNVVN